MDLNNVVSERDSAQNRLDEAAKNILQLQADVASAQREVAEQQHHKAMLQGQLEELKREQQQVADHYRMECDKVAELQAALETSNSQKIKLQALMLNLEEQHKAERSQLLGARQESDTLLLECREELEITTSELVNARNTSSSLKVRIVRRDECH